MKNHRVVICVLAASIAFNANAWMEEWAPTFDCEPAKFTELPRKSISNYVAKAVGCDAVIASASEGCELDLNGDRINDFVFAMPWMGCGLAGFGYDVHFVVSNGAGGRITNVISGYGVEMSDLVTFAGKTYFRDSIVMGSFEKSNHNHWVYQLFEFGTNGVIRSANQKIGKPFPAVTIYYTNPKFKQIELTASDHKRIEEENKKMQKSTPWNH